MLNISHEEGSPLTTASPILASVLIVDDEPGLRNMLKEFLTAQGCSVHTADGGGAMRDVLNETHVDVVVLDVRMPGEDGFSLARFLREHFDLGIIMLTAAGEVVDRILGLEIGADDYVTKPFDPRELLARIKSVLRRRPGTLATSADHRVRMGRYILDTKGRQLLTREGSEVPITSMEFDLLQAFVNNPNRVLSRDQLLESAHHRDWEPFDRSIDVRITRLRRKIEVDPLETSDHQDDPRYGVHVYSPS